MKFMVTRTDGTDNSGKKYLVVNIDEPYAGKIADMIEAEERRKGTWEHGDKTMREVMGIKKPVCNLVWNDESDCVMGAVADMTQEEFLERVKVDAEEMGIELPPMLGLGDIVLTPMIATDETIYGDQIRPLAGSGVVIEDYWLLEIA